MKTVDLANYLNLFSAKSHKIDMIWQVIQL